MKLMSILAGCGLAITLACGASAQTLIMGAEPDTIVEAADDLGDVSLTSQGNGDPLINGTLDGIGYQIYFRNCADDRPCEDLNFYAGFAHQPTLELINSWNHDKRFSRAYLDEVGDAVIEMDLDLARGVTEDYLKSQLALWPQVVGQFAEHIGYR